jgi:hypothetical protein
MVDPIPITLYFWARRRSNPLFVFVYLYICMSGLNSRTPGEVVLDSLDHQGRYRTLPLRGQQPETKM